MPEFSQLPQLVNRRILEYALNSDEMNINKKLILLGVCHEWRLMAMPLIYHTICIAEPENYYYYLKKDAWILSSPSGHRWYLNVASFNMRDVFRYAKKLNIKIESHRQLSDLYPLLEHIFFLGSCRPATATAINIDIGIYGATESDTISHHLQQIVGFLPSVIPMVADLALSMFGEPLSFTSFSTQMITRYSGPLLQTLKLTGYVGFDLSIDLKSVTVLDLCLFEDSYQILMCVEPRVLRKLSLYEKHGTYIWKYFTPVNHSDDNLEFTNLANLCIESDYEIDEQIVQGIDDAVIAQHRRLKKHWAADIHSRKVAFPTLKSLNFVNCYFVDLLFANCEFPSEISKVSIDARYSEIFSNYTWILENIPTSCIGVTADTDSLLSNVVVETFFASQSGSKIISLKLYEVDSLDPARINLPMLRTLNIYAINFSALLSLLPKLPRLYMLSLQDISYSSLIDLDSIVTPICPSVVKLVFGPFPKYYDVEKEYINYEFLLRSLSGLRFVVFHSEHDQLVSYVADHKGQYHHFDNLDVIVTETSQMFW